MSDKTELNAQLPDREAAVEAALRGIMLPDSAIDHDHVMYQAGWSAAIAEHGLPALQPNAAATIQTKRSAGYWPAIAMTFAATTAACLMVILLPAAENGSVAVSNTEPNQQEVVAKTDTAEQDDPNDVAHASPMKSNLAASLNIVPQHFGMARLLGGFIEKVTADRNALIEKHLAEAVSPSLADFGPLGDDRDFERREPLTARSVIPFSL